MGIRSFLIFGTNYSGKISRNIIAISGEELQSFRHCK